jgi:hypothetical protein
VSKCKKHEKLDWKNVGCVQPTTAQSGCTRLSGAPDGSKVYMSKWACRASPARARLDPTRLWRAQARHASVTGRAGLARGPKSLPKHGTPTVNRAGPGARAARWCCAGLGPSYIIHMTKFRVNRIQDYKSNRLQNSL